MPTRESMYKLLVRDPDDVLAGLAYTAYKRHQEEVMTRIELETGQPPTQADYEAFFRAASTDSGIDMYEERAASVINLFVIDALDQRMSELMTEYETTATAESLKAIRLKQDEKRTWKGWLADSMGNLAVNFVTIFLIAMAVTGVQIMDHLTGGFGKYLELLRAGVVAGPAAQVAPARLAPKTASDAPSTEKTSNPAADAPPVENARK